MGNLPLNVIVCAKINCNGVGYIYLNVAGRGINVDILSVGAVVALY